MELNGGEEIQELNPADDPPPNPIPNPEPKRRTVTTKVPEVEIHLFKRGNGPIATFRSTLGGWDQDLLDVQDILDKHALKTLYSFNPSSGRGVPIRFNPKNGRSILSYTDGSLVLVDGEPKDPLVKPVTKFLVGVVLISIVISVLMRNPPDWLKNSKFSTGMFPPWVLACAAVVFIRLRKRTKGLLKSYIFALTSRLGAVVRDDHGTTLVAAAQHFCHWDYSVVELVAVLALKNILEDWMLEVKGVTIEGGCINVVRHLQSSMQRKSWVQQPPKSPDIGFLLGFRQVLFAYTFREANLAAHFCASQVLGSSFTWSY